MPILFISVNMLHINWHFITLKIEWRKYNKSDKMKFLVYLLYEIPTLMGFFSVLKSVPLNLQGFAE